MTEYKIMVQTPDGTVREFVAMSGSLENAGTLALNAAPAGSKILAASGVTTGLKRS